MRIKTKYKIARRVGAPIFEKTQTPKYAQRLERKKKAGGFGRPKSEFGLELNEKQKARLSYGLSERQFSGYVKEAIKHSANAAAKAFEYLEYRLDNIVFRAGLGLYELSF
jgi:small subunit ribosomal protein S4